MSFPTVNKLQEILAPIAPFLDRLSDEEDMQKIEHCAEDFTKLRLIYSILKESRIVSEDYEELYVRYGRAELQRRLNRMLIENFPRTGNRFYDTLRLYYKNCGKLVLNNRHIILETTQIDTRF